MRHGTESLTGTTWYVPPAYLPAFRAINTAEPRIAALVDQTVWRFHHCADCYVTGISATNIGDGWSYNLMAGSVAPDGSVKISFSPLGAAGGQTSQTITIGDGTLGEKDGKRAFLMQMTAGSAASSVTHWATMMEATPRDPEWRALPGYPDTGVPDLTGLSTPIRRV